MYKLTSKYKHILSCSPHPFPSSGGDISAFSPQNVDAKIELCTFKYKIRWKLISKLLTCVTTPMATRVKVIIAGFTRRAAKKEKLISFYKVLSAGGWKTSSRVKFKNCRKWWNLFGARDRLKVNESSGYRQARGWGWGLCKGFEKREWRAKGYNEHAAETIIAFSAVNIERKI